MERVSTFGLGQTMLSSTLSLQSRLARAELQNASGLKTSTYTALGATDSSRLVSVEDALTKTKAWSSNTQTVLDRVEVMYNSVGSIADKMTSLRSTLSTAMSDTNSTTDYAALGDDLLDDLSALMNVQVDGRYLFGGSRTDTAPVDVSLLTAAPTTADTSYYQGDSSLASIRVSDDQTITYGVTADTSGFEKALRAANMLKDISSSATSTSSVDSSKVKAAYDLATDALKDLLKTQGGLSLSSSRLEAVKTTQDNAVTMLTDRVSDLKSVDVAEVSVTISQLQNTLEASYSALGKITSLSLVKYL
ncbi:flagellin [Magnetospirillum fulvum]|uniref:Flagellar hook-associated protein FlgL n=1 Tax=Magnetospirillum fulvum MGU-K5 TaxID=1316936 RepID=S9S8I4_MAGFU|nr:flagellin [Magnetospirillum fulvum]EPY02202.1 flagellar hook-associated protein FlgL [Magnetospirillum fulvum MGU-K5]